MTIEIRIAKMLDKLIDILCIDQHICQNCWYCLHDVGDYYCNGNGGMVKTGRFSTCDTFEDLEGE